MIKSDISVLVSIR